MKECPDLASMTADQRADFWSNNDPRELRRLGDRLLAECLPREHKSGESREALSLAASQARTAAGWSRASVAKVLGVSEAIVESWETDQVQPPDSLLLILKRMAALGIALE